MRARQVIERYRDFAARTHLVMGVFALGLIAAIIVLMIVSAVPSQAGFLAAEAKNLVTMAPTGDILLIATVAAVFLAVLVVKILDYRNPAK
ncbi:hypothetical protein [Taklimakanibacter deserti]|uniref:hypothetical protein n=1 Tax=Taklimakanibacter deserti TaxID=2267839 RepID=UPI000E657460